MREELYNDRWYTLIALLPILACLYNIHGLLSGDRSFDPWVYTTIGNIIAWGINIVIGAGFIALIVMAWSYKKGGILTKGV